ncbi:MAG TPA: ABC transporter ATP-binding protein [Candidatus Lokiarchaeia archaeon]|nr:ABC transporter ATP-binding protein [Candidatus Lokiarchaeia archaeon]
MAIVQFKSVTFSYHLGDRDFPALEDVTLDIEPGTVTLLCGPTGCGKSSLIRALNGLVPHFYEGHLSGQVLVNGKDTRVHSTRELSLEVGLVFQDPENQLIAMNVERELAFGPENLGLPREEIGRRVESALNATDIQHLRKKSPYELSGGEQQRVAIASVLALDPPIIALDEPTSSLDPQRAESILGLLAKFKNQGKTIIIVEHRLELVLPIVDKMVVMDKGRIVAVGSVGEVLQQEAPVINTLDLPPVVELFRKLLASGGISGDIPFSVEEASDILVRKLEEGD